VDISQFVLRSEVAGLCMCQVTFLNKAHPRVV